MKNVNFVLILLSIILGVTFGIFFPEKMLKIRWIGTLFINLLKLIVLPLIFSSLVSAITSMGGVKRLGSISTYTICYVLLSVSIAVLIGLTLFNIFHPGVGVPANFILANVEQTDQRKVEFSTFMLTLFPSNIIEAAAKFEIMPIVLFSIAFAIACLATTETSKLVVEFCIGLRNIFIKMIIWLMYLTPLGLFSLLGTAIAEVALQNRLMQSMKSMALFVLIFLIGLCLHISWQFIILKIICKRDPKKFFKSASNAMVTAFATSSSMATLPVALIAAKNENIRDDVARFVLPLATTINLAGTAMYEAVSALFFCQILGMQLSITSQISVFITAILAGMGATGIPEGGLVTMIIVLRSVNVPTAAIGILLPFDRILDRFRTMVNVWGDLVCSATVDCLVSQKQRSLYES